MGGPREPLVLGTNPSWLPSGIPSGSPPLLPPRPPNLRHGRAQSSFPESLLSACTLPCEPTGPQLQSCPPAPSPQACLPGSLSPNSRHIFANLEPSWAVSSDAQWTLPTTPPSVLGPSRHSLGLNLRAKPDTSPLSIFLPVLFTWH